MAALYETDSDSEFEGFDASDIIPHRIQHEDSDSDIEVSSISSIDSPITSDEEDNRTMMVLYRSPEHICNLYGLSRGGY